MKICKTIFTISLHLLIVNQARNNIKKRILENSILISRYNDLLSQFISANRAQFKPFVSIILNELYEFCIDFKTHICLEYGLIHIEGNLPEINKICDIILNIISSYFKLSQDETLEFKTTTDVDNKFLEKLSVFRLKVSCCINNRKLIAEKVMHILRLKNLPDYVDYNKVVRYNVFMAGIYERYEKQIWEILKQTIEVYYEKAQQS